jgi:hypothetical protein
MKSPLIVTVLKIKEVDKEKDLVTAQEMGRQMVLVKDQVTEDQMVLEVDLD